MRRPFSRRTVFRHPAFPSRGAAVLALLSAALVVLSFPDFNLYALAWVALVPLLVAVMRSTRASHGFFLGWLTGATYLYASTYWLTYPMIHYAGIPSWIAYPLLAPATLIVGLFPALACYVLARLALRWGARAVFAAPLLWVAGEWARLQVTGQLWNALGYTQAYTPELIQAARWGGVYAVSFFLVMCSAAVAYLFIEKGARRFIVAPGALLALACVVWLNARTLQTEVMPSPMTNANASAVVIAVQPNVIPDFTRPAAEVRALFQRHLTLSAGALAAVEADANLRDLPRVVIFPESPMNFQYKRDAAFREALADFASRHRTSVLFNAMEPAPRGGSYNSAVLVDEGGRLVGQYDKIQLLAFGEYVPLPSWLPGREFVRGVVGEFTPGERYTLMPLGEIQSGVFICFESAFPDIARRFADGGADVLINISNDAYQGRTAVLRQHLANSIFRAVETNRPLLRVTNTGITARISPRGVILDETPGYEPMARVWTITTARRAQTFYTRYGDLFAVLCFIFGVTLFGATLRIFKFNRLTP